MGRWPHLGRDLLRGAVTGLVLGIALGLAEILILAHVDQMVLLARSRFGLVFAFGALGTLAGLILGVLRSLGWAPWVTRQGHDAGPTSSKLAPPPQQRAAENLPGRRGSHLVRTLAQGLGAGLMASVVVSAVDVVGLLVVTRSWNSLTGLLYAVIVYGVLGLLGGLGLGLLRGVWYRKQGAAHSTWVVLTTLLVSLGGFLAVHHRVSHDVLQVSLRDPDLAERLVADSALLAIVAALSLALSWLVRRLARHTRLARLRWSVGLYVALVLVAFLVSEVAISLAAPPAGPVPRSDVPLVPGLRDRPNVLLIVAETLRADRLGCYGHDGDLTPHLDVLAQDGVVYRQMSAQASWTRPSVATILTSLYPTSHRTRTMAMSLSDDVVTLPESLSAAGYRTRGLVTIANVAPALNFGQGFDGYTYLAGDRPFFAPESPAAMRLAAFAVLRSLYDVVQPFATWPRSEIYQDAAAVNRRALAWLEANQDARFFLYLHYFDPHDPYFAHPGEGDRVSRRVTPNPDPAQLAHIRQLYDGEVSYLDARLGELFEALKQRGLYDDMLIVFTADHGEEFQEHGGWWHGDTLYEEQIAVPLIVKYPGNAHAGTVDDEIARSLDIAPTVLDVVRISTPEGMQGVSLRPGAGVSRAEFTLAEVHSAGVIRAVRTKRYKLVVASPSNLRGLIPVELYDLQADPGERRNLAASDPDTVRQLRTTLDQVVAYAQANAVADQSGEVDADTRERLRQLGY